MRNYLIRYLVTRARPFNNQLKIPQVESERHRLCTPAEISARPDADSNQPTGGSVSETLNARATRTLLVNTLLRMRTMSSREIPTTRNRISKRSSLPRRINDLARSPASTIDKSAPFTQKCKIAVRALPFPCTPTGSQHELPTENAGNNPHRCICNDGTGLCSFRRRKFNDYIDDHARSRSVDRGDRRIC